jgi:hypothetical protein
MQHLDGSVLHAADIKARTAAVLKDRFANICTSKRWSTLWKFRRDGQPIQARAGLPRARWTTASA